MREGWHQVRLGDIVTTERRLVHPGRMGEGPVRLYSIPGFDAGAAPEEIAPSMIGSAKSSISRPSVLVSLLNPRIPRTLVAQPGTYCSPEFLALQPCTQITLEFLALLVSDVRFSHFIDVPSKGTTGSRKRAKREDVLAYSLSLPPVQEQRRIVDLMSHVDEAISDGRKEVEGLERYHWSLAESLISSAEGFEVRLGTVSSIVRGGSPRPIDGYYTDDPDGLPWVRIGDVAADGKYITNTEKRIDRSGLSKTRTVAPGDFVLSNSMSFGRPYIVELHGCIHDGWLKISDYEDTFTSDFLYYLLRSQRVQDQFESRAAGSGVRNLKKESVGATVVTAPALDYQKEATRVLSTVATHVATTTDALSLLQELRRGLLESLLSGQREIPSSYDEFIRDEGAA